MRIKECRDYLEMTTRSITAFANNGRMGIDEFNEIVDIALRDRVVDENEKRVLGSIINILLPHELTVEMCNRIEELRVAYGIKVCNNGLLDIGILSKAA